MARSWIGGLVIVIVLGGLVGNPAIGQVPKGKELDRERDEALRDFATRVRRIALQYEQAGDREKARSTLRLLLQTAPNDAEAKAMLDRISKQELAENKTFVKVMANQGWQNTGVQVFAGKPVVIEAKGTWVFRMNRVVTADGLEVPDDMKIFPLGSLVGAIEQLTEVAASPPRRDAKITGQSTDDILGLPPIEPGEVKDTSTAKKSGQSSGARPFLIGANKVFNPPATGTLFLKIHDSHEADNSGELTVTISGQIRVQSGAGSHAVKSQR